MLTILLPYIKAFVFGGLLCVIAQVLIDKTGLTPARILVGYVTAGVLLTAVGFYGPFADFAGAGATVPLSGFGYLLAKGTVKAVQESGLMGALTGGLAAAAAGIASAVIFGYLFALMFKGKAKS